MHLIHSQAIFCCSELPDLPRLQVSPPSGATTVPPGAFVGIGTIPYSRLYFQPAAFSSGKIHGPFSIIAAVLCRNCWVRSGSWPHWRTDLDAEPSLTMLTHSWRDSVNAGVFTWLRSPPWLQKNGSSCHVDCSSAVASNAMPWTCPLVRALASDWSSAQVFGGDRCAAANIALL